MQLKLLFGLALAAVAMAADKLKPVIITFPKDTPTSVIDEAKQGIIDGGGKITHVYTLINGFAAQAPQESLDTLSTLDATYKPTVDEDTVVSING